MSILEIELTPSIEKKLDEGAKKSGVSKAEYARAMLEKTLTAGGESDAEPQKTGRSIMELHGLGAEIWRGEQGELIDAQAYVNELRDEWDKDSQ